MEKLILLFVVVALMTFIERVFFITMTSTVKGRQFIISHRWLHPNPICIYRLPMGVVSCLIWMSGYPSAAAIFFSFWMITDMTDGTIARGCGLGSETGKWLDPLSDKFMYIPLLLLLTQLVPENASTQYETLCLGAVLLFIVFDVLSQLSRLFVEKTAANSFGKAKTMMICITLVVASFRFIAFDAFVSLPVVGKINPNYLMWSCVALGFLSFYCKVIPDHWYANSLTLMNFICGVAAIPLVLVDQNLVGAFILIFLGQFFDLLDGRTARKFGSTKWGALFDDIADGTSFGLAIAVIVYVTVLPLGIFYAVIASVLYFVCVVYRLYFFIINKDTATPGVFIGMPSPAGAMLAGSAALLFHDGSLIWVTFFTTIIASGLMISKIEYKHFGQKIVSSVPNAIKLTVFAIILIYITILVREQDQLSDAFAIFSFSMIWIYIFVGVNLKKNK